MRTLALSPSTLASFWLSSSSITAAEYWPLRFGVAERYDAAPAAAVPGLLLDE